MLIAIERGALKRATCGPNVADISDDMARPCDLYRRSVYINFCPLGIGAQAKPFAMERNVAIRFGSILRLSDVDSNARRIFRA